MGTLAIVIGGGGKGGQQISTLLRLDSMVRGSFALTW